MSQTLLEVRFERAYLWQENKDGQPFALGRKCFVSGEPRGSTAVYQLFCFWQREAKRLVRQERTDRAATCCQVNQSWGQG